MEKLLVWFRGWWSDILVQGKSNRYGQSDFDGVKGKKWQQPDGQNRIPGSRFIDDDIKIKGEVQQTARPDGDLPQQHGCCDPSDGSV